MSEGPTPIESFRVDLHLGATFSINGDEHWVKPGTTTGITWKGLPTQRELELALKFMEEQILQPVMNDLADQVIQRTKRAKNIE